MNPLRRCHSMPLDFQRREDLRSRNYPFSSTGQIRKAESMRLTSPRAADLCIGHFLAVEKPLKPMEPILPLLLDSQHVASGPSSHLSVSIDQESWAKIRQKAIHDSGDCKMKKEAGVDDEILVDRGAHIKMHRRKRLLSKESTYRDCPRKISETIQKTIGAQQKVSGMRVQLAEMRSDLDNRRTAQVFQWADQLKEIKSMLSSAPLGNTTTTCITMQLCTLETISQHADDYLLLENEYQDFQRQLEAEEHKLQHNQTCIAEMLQNFSDRSHATWLDRNADSSSVYQETQDVWAITEDNSDTTGTVYSPTGLNPLLEKYLNEIGEVRMYQERLGELSLEHAEISGREASFALVNMSLDQDSQNFLDNYESQRLELEQLISEKMDAAASLWRQCEKEGISLPTNLQHGVETELDMDIKEALPQERDLLWLSELDDNNTFLEMVQTRDFNMYDFINGWLFHQLRHSTSQINRFKSNPRLQDLNMDGDYLSERAIKLWFQDANSKLASPLRTSIGSDKLSD